jgi:hypothetical protein
LVLFSIIAFKNTGFVDVYRKAPFASIVTTKLDSSVHDIFFILQMRDSFNSTRDEAEQLMKKMLEVRGRVIKILLSYRC